MSKAPFKMRSGNSPLFKNMGSSPAQTESSPNKFNWDEAAAGAAVGGAAGAATMGIGAIPAALVGGIIGGAGPSKETRETEEEFEGEITEAGLQRGFWGRMGFGGRRARERKSLIARLKREKFEGQEREKLDDMITRGRGASGPGAV